MTEKEILQKRVQELEAEIEGIKRQSTQYLQNVAHQLTAPLGAIKWSIEAIKDEEVPATKKQKLLSSVYSQATILVHLIKNFALMSNLEADHELGEFRDTPDKVDIFRLCINLANDFQPQAMETDKKIEVSEDSFIKTIGVNQLMIVKNLVAQALSNLLENAVKYADAGSVISVYASRGEMLGITVKSAGIPLRQEDIPSLTNRGYRGKAAREKVPAGTGIGLYLAERIMKLHGGRIDVVSDGRTSLFTLCFPWNRAVK